MQPPPSAHTHFFSSLKQVEKRLKSDRTSKPTALSSPTPVPPQEDTSDYAPTESVLGSPIYLNFDRPPTSTSTVQESAPPQEFLSNSLDFPPTREDPPPQSSPEENPPEIYQNDGVDDIQLLMQLLGLSEGKEGDEQVGDSCGLECWSDDGFLGDIVGVKGPKCKKEVARLEGWITYFMNGGGMDEKMEPLRLAHLLLGKAALLASEEGGLGGFDFPSTVDEFLQNDPPTD
ncbi:hypothetical protein RJ639_036730 [Escallonia herrerae]|uniref:Uncharacterized protein n=1 Tax=Escallonia herrerae TaxID=1293975 RepID=A0AA88VD11_9ASTE|nr:hypothetical protein RJ639_015785 [Escallonia herrerae]KAK3032666.1 hypothetical protein RJ639_036730 [Escallonia herrerae]